MIAGLPSDWANFSAKRYRANMLVASEFERMAGHAGLIDRSDRVRLEIKGRTVPSSSTT